jgi:hypothetical protein
MTHVALSKAQRRLLKLLEAHSGEWVSRFELMGLGIVGYRQRIRELRAAGFRIENKRGYAGKLRDSCYRLVGKLGDENRKAKDERREAA